MPLLDSRPCHRLGVESEMGQSGGELTLQGPEQQSRPAGTRQGGEAAQHGLADSGRHLCVDGAYALQQRCRDLNPALPIGAADHDEPIRGHSHLPRRRR